MPKWLTCARIGWCFTLVSCVTLLSGERGPIAEFSRVIGAVAPVGEASARGASKAVEATTAVVATASEAVLKAATNTMNFSYNAWQGIDLLDVQASKCAGKLIADTPEVAELWLRSAEASRLLPCLSDDMIQSEVAAAKSVGHALPVLEVGNEDVDVGGKYGTLKVHAAVTAAGQLKIEFESCNLSFRVVWANPLWELAAYPTSSEREQILSAITSAVSQLPLQQHAWLPGDAAFELPWNVWLKGKIHQILRLCWIIVGALCEYGILLGFWFGSWLLWWFRREAFAWLRTRTTTLFGWIAVSMTASTG